MPDQELIDGLIASYRELNMKIRRLDPSQLGDIASRGDGSITGILRQMRDRELRASQAMRVMVLGEDAETDDEVASAQTDTLDQAADSPIFYLAQFGTAREATLAMIREQPDEVWDREVGTPQGRMSVKAYVRTLVDRDRERLQQIDELLVKAGAPEAARIAADAGQTPSPVDKDASEPVS